MAYFCSATNASNCGAQWPISTLPFSYIAESVWDLDRDTGQEPDAKQRTNAELTILKNRHGSAGVSIDLKFEGRLQRFMEAEP